MMNRSLTQIARMAGGTLRVNQEHADAISIQGVSIDTRSLRPGNLFVPLPGNHIDGHEHVAAALSKEVAAAFWKRGYPNPPEDAVLIFVDDPLKALQRLSRQYREQCGAKIIGITGSNGKTTTKDLVASVLGTTYRVHKTQGNLNNHIGLPLTLLQIGEDTEVAVIEMGMSGRGEIELLSELAQPDMAIITMIGDAHLLQLGSREEIARAKTEILGGLQDGGLFISNGDEPLIDFVLPEIKKPEEMRRVSFGQKSTNNIYPVDIQIGNDGSSFRLQDSDTEFYIPLLGLHNVMNALAAVAAGRELEVSDEKIAQGLRDVQLSGMRIEKRKAESGFTVLNDAYNASPAATKAALSLMKQLKGYRHKYVVLADMLELGELEEQFHREIGGIAANLAEQGELSGIYTYGPLGRYIAEEAKARFPLGNTYWFEDKQAMANALKEVIHPEDVVLVKASRGMKLEDVVNFLLA